MALVSCLLESFLLPGETSREGAAVLDCVRGTRRDIKSREGCVGP